jgi:hypothetical protein
VTNRAFGSRRRAIRALEGGRTRSLSPQATVTGTSTLSVNRGGAWKNARIAAPVRVKFATSPRACSGVIFPGWLTMTP